MSNLPHHSIAAIESIEFQTLPVSLHIGKLETLLRGRIVRCRTPLGSYIIEWGSQSPLF